MKKAVFVSCFDWYDTRIKPIRDYLSNYFETIVYTSDFNHIEKKKINNKNQYCNYVNVRKYKKNLSVSRILSHLNFSSKIYKILKKEKPDLIYCLLPPNSLAKKCIKYKKKHNCKVIFDVIDMWPESMPLDNFSKISPYKIWKNYRDKNIKYADYLITECDLYYNSLNKYVEADSHSTIYLYKSIDNWMLDLTYSKINNYEFDGNKLKLCYLGSINNIIDVDTISIIVSKLMTKYDVEFHIIGTGESVNSFIESLNKTGCEIINHGKIFDEKKKLEIISKCNFGINIMKSNVKVGLTIKSIDYLCYGIPLINNIKYDTWNIVDEYSVGINVQDSNIDFGKVELMLTKEKHLEVHSLYEKLFTIDAFKMNIKKVFEKILK